MSARETEPLNPSVKPLSILLVEDSPEYASLVLRWLSGAANQIEFTLIWTDSLAAALARLEQADIDLILMDLGLPDSDGLATFLSLRAKESALPIIVLSGGDYEALALQTIQLGAQDYLVKSSCTPELLIRALRYALVRHQSFTSREGALEASGAATVVGVLGGCGGAGATTVACILAAELQHHTDQSTLLIDLDSNPGRVAFTMGIDPQYSVQDAVANADRLDRTVWETLITHRPGNLDVLASAMDIADDDPDMESVLKVVRFAAKRYRWIVMDLGRLNRRSKRLLEIADDLILVTTKSIPALHQCKHAIEMVRDLGIDQKRVRLILNQKQDGERLSGKQIENVFGVPIEAMLPPAHEDLSNAYLKRRLPSVTGSFRLALTAVACKMAGLPEQMPKRSLLSLTGLRERFQPKVRESEESLAS